MGNPNPPTGPTGGGVGRVGPMGGGQWGLDVWVPQVRGALGPGRVGPTGWGGEPGRAPPRVGAGNPPGRGQVLGSALPKAPAASAHPRRHPAPHRYGTGGLGGPAPRLPWGGGPCGWGRPEPEAPRSHGACAGTGSALVCGAGTPIGGAGASLHGAGTPLWGWQPSTVGLRPPSAGLGPLFMGPAPLCGAETPPP